MDTFGDNQYSLDSIGTEAASQIAKQRAILEQKEKGEDMSKTVGETKLFMSSHGIAGALKPLKPRIKKLAGRKANEFKKTIKNKVSDYLDGDGGKTRRFNEFKQNQDKLNEDESFEGARKRFGKLSDEDKDDIRQNLKEDPEFSSKETIGNLAEEDQEAAQLKNTQLLRDQVSEKETGNFIDNDAKEVAENEASSTLDNVKNAISDAGSAAKNAIKNVFKSGEDTLNSSTNALNKDAIADTAKKVLKGEAKTMAEGEVEGEVADTAAGLASSALDAIPGADILGVVLGAGIAIKKAIQVKKLERKDETLIANKPIVGSLQQVGV